MDDIERIKTEHAEIRAKERERIAQMVEKLPEDNWCRSSTWAGRQARHDLVFEIRTMRD